MKSALTTILPTVLSFTSMAQFAQPVEIVSQARGMAAHEIVDWDNDGDPDLVGPDLYFYLLKNDGSGNFDKITLTSPSFGGYSYFSNGHSFADLNNDGYQDIIYRSSDALFCLPNDGNGGALPPVQLLNFPGLGSNWSLIQIADVEDDGYLDLIFKEQYTSTGFTICKNAGNFNFSQYFMTVSMPIRFADFNADGHIDLLRGNWNNYWLAYGSGGGQFTDSIHLPVFSTYLSDVRIIDLDQDGDLDIFSSGSSKYVLKNENNQSFTGPQSVSLPGSLGSLTDLTNDGFPDFLGLFPPYTLSINDGSGGFPTYTTLNLNITVNPLYIADYNNDGYSDIGNLPGIAFADGPGSYGNDNRQISSSGSTLVDLADLNADGNFDLIYREADGLKFKLFENNTYSDTTYLI